MKEHNNIIEKNFLSKIDCKFPYTNKNLRNELINQAFEISSNSVFAIIEELARVPKSQKEKISNNELLTILENINVRLKHPLKKIVIDNAVKMIYNTELPVREALDLMNEIEKFTGQWSALNIIYFSCDDINGIVDKRYDEIKEKWVRNNDTTTTAHKT